MITSTGKNKPTERQEEMSGYGIYIDGELVDSYFAKNDTTAMMRAMAYAIDNGVTKYKLCRKGCFDDVVLREVASIDDDTVM